MKKIKFYIPFSMETIQFNYCLVDLFERHNYVFYDNYEIGAFYGSFGGCVWNGGSRNSLKLYHREEIDEVVKFMKLHNIPIRLTFTNRLLSEKYMCDLYGNMMLDACNNGKNEILIASEIMEKYIKENWTNYKVVRSICWSDETPYDDSERFHMSVLNEKYNYNYEMLNSIKNKDKVEILLNEICFPNCKLHFKHYDYTANEYMNFKQATNFCQNHHSQTDVFWVKKLRELDKEYVTKERLEKYFIPNGFSNFKICGRNYNISGLIDDVLYYMIKPEYHRDIRFNIYGLLFDKIVI